MKEPAPEPRDEDERRAWQFFGFETMRRQEALVRLSDAPPISALAGARLRERVVVRLQRAWGYGRGVGSQLKFWTTGINTPRELMHARRINEHGKPQYLSWKRGTNPEKEREASSWWKTFVGTPEPDAPGREVEEAAMILISPISWRKFLLDATTTSSDISDEDLDEATTHLARAFEVILRPWLENDTVRVRAKSMTSLCHLVEGHESGEASRTSG